MSFRKRHLALVAIATVTLLALHAWHLESDQTASNHGMPTELLEFQSLKEDSAPAAVVVTPRIPKPEMSDMLMIFFL